jgi:hypothetical protein
MKAIDLIPLFEQLVPSGENGRYVIHSVRENLYLAKLQYGEYCLLLRYPLACPLPMGRVTRGLELSFYSEADFLLNGERTHANWAIVSCKDTALNDLFVVLAAGIDQQLINNKLITPFELATYIADWQELLAHRKELTFAEYVGLWGELHLLLKASDRETAVARWNGPTGKTFDFSHSGVEVEVKTSLRGHVHTFSEKQLQSSTSQASRYIASQYVEEDFAGGRTLTALVEKVRDGIQSEAEFVQKLLSVGYSGPLAIETPLSLRQLLLVHIEDVPKVTAYDPGVARISYESDLSFCEGIEDTVSVLNKLFAR